MSAWPSADTNNAEAAGLQSRYITMMTDHGYPRNKCAPFALARFSVGPWLTSNPSLRSGIINHEIGQLNNIYFKKFFLIGEYDWTADQGGVPLSTYLDLIEANKPNIGE